MTSRDNSDVVLDGYAYANAETIIRVPGGVLARSAQEGRAQVVIGGGSGHFPAFAGFVGQGMADAAVAGATFASPSTARIVDVTSHLNLDRGALLLFGHYTGDLLNFNAAAQQLREAGHDVRTLPITDDIASAPATAAHDRRGIAGDLVVTKVAAAAAATGATIDGVEQAARKANHRTSSLGVAYSGCTLPDADAPLFTLEPGTMGVGMGIHGEPGLDVEPRQEPAVVLDRLLDSVIEDLDERVGFGDSPRVALVVNGLGGMPTEHVLGVGALAVEGLSARGFTVVRPLIGEFCTSFDMDGFSVTLTVLDDELEQHWLAPASSTVVTQTSNAADYARVSVATQTTNAEQSDNTGDVDAGATTVAQAFAAIHELAEEKAPVWGELDAVAGDGDHGIGMLRGITGAANAAHHSAAAGAGLDTTLLKAAQAWGDNAGGTSGAIWQGMLEAAARRLGANPTPRDAIAAVHDAVTAITTVGGAVEGDKTLLDAARPFAVALADTYASSSDFAQAWDAGVAAAARGRDHTSTYGARRGRARTHADASIGTPDPGAVSLTDILERIGPLLTAVTRKDS